MTTISGTRIPRRSLRSPGGDWLIGLGVLSLVSGVVGLAMAMTLTIAAAVWYGALLTVLGGAHAIQAMVTNAVEDRWIKLLFAAAYLVVGLLILVYPVTAAVTLTVLIGMSLIFLGALRAVWAFRVPADARLWILVSALVSGILGVLIISEWPLSGLWVLGVFIATDLILYGIGVIRIALSPGRRVPSARTNVEVPG